MRILTSGLLMLVGVSLISGMAWAQQITPPFDAVDTLTVEVLATYPHDPEAFTQGLLIHEGVFYESTGQYGKSDLRSVEIETGEVLRQFSLPEEIFAEGLARVEDRLIQISWREQGAIVYRLADGAEEQTFAPDSILPYTGEGWGICYDGSDLFMSDGSSALTVRDATTFEAQARIPVTLYGLPIENLNELECVGEHVWANVWMTDTILRIDKSNGRVDGVVNVSGLLDEATRNTLDGNAVLNGIAYDAEQDNYLITGKLWSSMFRVNFVPATE